jgi:hypothetical protein
MSASDKICTYCGREGHTASSCPRREAALTAFRRTVVTMAALAGFAAGWMWGQLADVVLTLLQRPAAVRTAPTPPPPPLPPTRWRVTVTHLLGDEIPLDITAAYPQSALAAASHAYPHRRRMTIRRLEA